MHESIVRICLQSGLDTVEGKCSDGRQDAGRACRHLGAVALYPPLRLVLMLLLLLLLTCCRRRRLTSTAELRHAGGGWFLERLPGSRDILFVEVDSLSCSSRHGLFLAVSKESIAGQASDSGPGRGPESSARSLYCDLNCRQMICHQRWSPVFFGGCCVGEYDGLLDQIAGSDVLLSCCLPQGKLSLYVCLTANGRGAKGSSNLVWSTSSRRMIALRSLSQGQLEGGGLQRGHLNDRLQRLEFARMRPFLVVRTSWIGRN
jgi:hypothetical protein